MSNKSTLLEASQNLQKAWDEILKIADENPSLMIYYHEKNPTTGKSFASYGESLGAFCEQSDNRIAFIRKRLGMYAEQFPKGKRRKKNG